MKIHLDTDLSVNTNGLAADRQTPVLMTFAIDNIAAYAFCICANGSFLSINEKIERAPEPGAFSTSSIRFQMQAPFVLERRPQGVPVQPGLLRNALQGQHHAFFHAFQAAHIKVSIWLLQQQR